jgi:hypothetical protein
MNQAKISYHILLIGFLFLVSCSGKKSSESYRSADSTGSYEALREAKVESSSVQVDKSEPKKEEEEKEEPRKVVYTADLRIKTEDITESEKKVKAILNRNSAFIVNQELFQTDYEKQIRMSIHVPVNKFDSTLAEIERAGLIVDTKRVSSADVTDEFHDAELRLQSKKKALVQYQAILQRAVTIEEIIRVQQEVTRIIEEVEMIEGRLNSITSQSTYSTINVVLFKPELHTSNEKVGFSDRFVFGLSRGWEVFLDFIIVLANIWPLILIVIAFFVIRKYLRSKGN